MYQPTIDALMSLNLNAMAQAYLDQQSNSAVHSLGFDERFGFLVSAQKNERETKKIKRVIAQSNMKVSACIEDINYQAPRGLDRIVIANLSTCEWIYNPVNTIITGPSGVGKTWLACALGNQAARKGFRVIYKRLSRLLEELQIAAADGTLSKLRTKIKKTQLLILDDWALSPISAQGRHELLEIIDDRVGSGSILITSQLPVAQWHDYFGEPTVADAILDRLVHRAHRIELRGESLRKTRGTNTANLDKE